MWSDNEANIDLINVNDKVVAIEEIIANQGLLPTTIGVFGDWGSGKSSLMRIVQNTVDKKERVITISFNGWVFEDYEDAKSALMGRIIDDLIASKSLSTRGKEITKKLLKRINWFRLVGLAGKNILSMSLVGTPDKDILSDLSKSFGTEELEKALEDPDRESLRKSISEFREDFQRLMKELEIEKLVVFIDDLDRCLPDTILEIFEAIRLFLFVPSTAFVIGADERIVEHAIKTRYPTNSSRLDIGRNYLEKIIQFPIRIPPMSVQETETYINLLFAKLYLEDDDFGDLCGSVLDYKPETIFDIGFNLNNCGEFIDEVPGQLINDLEMSHQISKILSTGLQGNPRQIKRFLNTLIIRIKMAEAKNIELSRKLLVKLMVLEYFEPTYYKKLREEQSKNDGKPSILNKLELFIEKGDDEEENLDLNNEEQKWFENDTVHSWLQLQPSLTGKDLRPYFYFSREDEGNYYATKSPLTPDMKEILSLFISTSDAETEQALNKVDGLSQKDIEIVFSEIMDKMHRSEGKKERVGYIKICAKMGARNKYLVPILLENIGTVSASKMGYAIPDILSNLGIETGYEDKIRNLFEKWENEDLGKGFITAISQAKQKL